MEPRPTIGGIVIAVVFFLGFFSLIAVIVVIALSPEKWGTIKRMILAWIATLGLVMASGFVVGFLTEDLAVVRAMGAASVGLAFLAAAGIGIRHVRSVRQRPPTDLSIK